MIFRNRICNYSIAECIPRETFLIQRRAYVNEIIQECSKKHQHSSRFFLRLHVSLCDTFSHFACFCFTYTVNHTFSRDQGDNRFRYKRLGRFPVLRRILLKTRCTFAHPSSVTSLRQSPGRQLCGSMGALDSNRVENRHFAPPARALSRPRDFSTTAPVHRKAIAKSIVRRETNERTEEEVVLRAFSAVHRAIVHRGIIYRRRMTKHNLHWRLRVAE